MHAGVKKKKNNIPLGNKTFFYFILPLTMNRFSLVPIRKVGDFADVGTKYYPDYVT